MISHSIPAATCLKSNTAPATHPLHLLPWKSSAPSSPSPVRPSKKMKLVQDPSKMMSPLSESDREQILQECYDPVVSHHQHTKHLTEFSPDFAAFLSPTDLIIADTFPHDVVRHQMQVSDYIATFNSRLSSAIPISTPDLLGELVQHMCLQVQRLLHDNVSRIQRSRAKWAIKRFDELRGTTSTLATAPASIFSGISAFRRFDGVASGQASTVNSVDS